jgi:hypothetical protein
MNENIVSKIRFCYVNLIWLNKREKIVVFLLLVIIASSEPHRTEKK